MGEKMEKADKLRFENQQKWEKFVKSGKHLTPELIKDMRADNERVNKVCEEATREWLQEKIDRGELETD